MFSELGDLFRQVSFIGIQILQQSSQIFGKRCEA